MFWLDGDFKQVSIKNVAIGVFLVVLAGYGYFGQGSTLLPFLNDGANLAAIGLIGVGSIVYGLKGLFVHGKETDKR